MSVVEPIISSIAVVEVVGNDAEDGGTHGGGGGNFLVEMRLSLAVQNHMTMGGKHPTNQVIRPLFSTYCSQRSCK